MILDKKSDWFSRVMYKKYIFVSEYIVKLKTRVMLNAMRTFFVFLSVGLLGFLFSVDICAADRVYNVSDFGLKANVKKDERIAGKAIKLYFSFLRDSIIFMRKMLPFVNITFPITIKLTRRR